VQQLGLEIPERWLLRLDEPVGLPDEACTTDVYVRDFWPAKQAAIACHATQLHPDSVFAAVPAEIMSDLMAWECFQLAEDRIGADEEAHDLLAGLREHAL